MVPESVATMASSRKQLVRARAPPPAASSACPCRVPRSCHQLAPLLHAGLRLSPGTSGPRVRSSRGSSARSDAPRVADQRRLDRVAQADPRAGRGRSARRAPARASGRTRCRESSLPTISSVSQLFERFLRRPRCRAGRCRRWCRGCRRAPPPCRAAPWRSARRAARRPLAARRRRRARRARPGCRPCLPAFRISAARRELRPRPAACAPRAMQRREHVPGDVALRARVRARPAVDCMSTGHGDVRHAAAGQRRAAGELDDVLDVRRAHDPRVVDADVHEQLVELDVLLRVGADQVVVLQAGDREHRLRRRAWRRRGRSAGGCRPGPEVARHTPSRPVYLA